PGFNIGFYFEFDGNYYDKLGVSTNGWISLGQSSLTPSVNMSNASGGTFFWPIISDGFAGQPAVLQNRIAPLCIDLQGRTGSSIRIETIGIAPNRTCVIQWANIREYG